MKQFADLFTLLDQTNKTNSKISLLAAYFDEAEDQDKLWTLALFTSRRPKRSVKTNLLREWASDLSNIPVWLLEESYHIVGDLAETLALILPAPTEENTQGLSAWINYVREMESMEEAEKEIHIKEAWKKLDSTERFVFHKIITGGFRVGVSQKLLVKALSKHTGQDENSIAHRLMGNWHPDKTTFEELILSENIKDDLSKPYPFYLAYALDDEPDSLGTPSDWQAEWKWDGIRSQLIIRGGEHFLWSRGEELITDKFPELAPLTAYIPDGTVIDGELLPFKDGNPLSFQALQTRIGRKNVTKKHLKEVPVIIMAYDLMEWEGKDMREVPLRERRKILESIVAKCPDSLMQPSVIVENQDWEKLAELREKAREYYSEGLMLKRKDSTYKVGRKRGDWWKWKVDPLTVDAVMIYAQRGHGRRANLYSDYTFAVWDGEKLVPFAKAYSGLTDAEMAKVDAWVKRNTRERFGPVRSVNPELVFEIGFEGINKSTRHKSGIALRFPRILKWRTDKGIEDADTLGYLHDLLEKYS
ncbi:MAG: ATP-dependent DNA ligase [Bacteroidota bacterium]